MEKVNAIILSAGKGKRMNSEISKQYLSVYDKPLIYYTLKAFEYSDIDQMIIVVGENDIEYMKKDIIEKYGIKKVSKIVEGGKERYDSVINGLKEINDAKWVLIHDGARALIRAEEINVIIDEVKKNGACVAGVPSKDTVKIVDENNEVINTPERKFVWQIQTPQAFDVKIIKEAYKKMLELDDKTITDDAMAVEKYANVNIKVIETSYENIKVTTQEDMIIVNNIIKNRFKKEE